ncbi:MAG: hypothetical protein HDQ88_08855 [Clostridia bacterium]|nr:hypothetical protein [Clostridia bacterium]
MVWIFNVGQRIKIRNKDLYGVVTHVDPDLPYVYMVRLDDRTYDTFTDKQLEGMENEDADDDA